MDAREMDATIAEWIEPKPDAPKHSGDPVWMRIHSGWLWAPCDGWKPYHFSADLNAMSRAEKVVNQRGLRGPYINELRKVIDPNDPIVGPFAFATATPAQRAEALVRMIRGMEAK